MLLEFAIWVICIGTYLEIMLLVGFKWYLEDRRKKLELKRERVIRGSGR